MTYCCYGSGGDYFFDQYYFQPSVQNQPITHVDFYSNWTSNGVCIPQATVPSNQNIPSNHIKFDRPNYNWPEPSPGASIYIARPNMFNSQNDFKSYDCPHCHKQYCRKSTLKAHLKQHLHYRPFVCQVVFILKNIHKEMF